jgi:hypothetical protein
MEQVRFLAATLLGAGQRLGDVASGAGIALRTLHNWKANPEFMQLVADAREQYRRKLLSRIADAAAGKLNAAAARDGENVA